MPYFIIIPAYGLLVVALAVAAIATRMVTGWKPATGYIIGGTIGSLIGFIISNVVITLLGLLPVMVTQDYAPDHWLRQCCAIMAAATLIAGPFVASATGIALGFGAGSLYVLRRRRNRAA